MRGEEQEKLWALLMRAGNAGDGDTYRRLLLLLTPVLRANARRGLAPAGMADTDAEDVVQETLLAIHLKRQSWDEEAPFGPWLRAIARHKMIDALRTAAAASLLLLMSFPKSWRTATPNRTCSPPMSAGISNPCPRGQRTIVQAIGVDGASIADAAARFSMTTGAVRVALHRGLSALARKFRTEEP